MKNKSLSDRCSEDRSVSLNHLKTLVRRGLLTAPVFLLSTSEPSMAMLPGGQSALVEFSMIVHDKSDEIANAFGPGPAIDHVMRIAASGTNHDSYLFKSGACSVSVSLKFQIDSPPGAMPNATVGPRICDTKGLEARKSSDKRLSYSLTALKAITSDVNFLNLDQMVGGKWLNEAEIGANGYFMVFGNCRVEVAHYQGYYGGLGPLSVQIKSPVCTGHKDSLNY